MKKWLGLIGLTLVVLSGLSILSTTRAQEVTPNQTITISPAVSRLQVEALQTRNQAVTIINNGTTNYTFTVYARPFSVTNEQYDPTFNSTSERTNAYKWISFEQTSFSLAAGERVEVPYTITVPADVAPGGHYSVIFAETQPPADSQSSTGVIRKERVGSLLYITAGGELEQAGSLAGWDVAAWQKQRPLTSDVRITNSGNVHFQADVSIQYSDLLGNPKFTLNQEVMVLPDTTRKVTANWARAPYLGIFKATGSVHYLDRTDLLPAQYIVLVSPLIVIATAVGFGVLIALIVVRRRLVKRNPGYRGKKRP